VGDVLNYLDELTDAMTRLGQQPNTVFIGQGVRYPGHALFKTLEGAPIEKRIELPVAEDMQMGMSIGLAMTGKTVIAIYPRMDFLLCAINQLVNHLDKGLYQMPGKVLIRTCVGATKPIHPGAQHCGDYINALRLLLWNVDVISLEHTDEIKGAYEIERSAVIVEYGDKYGMA